MYNTVINWQNYLRATGKAENTIIGYYNDMIQFQIFIKQYFGESLKLEDLANIKLMDLRSWLADRKKNAFKNSSNSRAISAVKSFFEYIHQFHDIENQDISVISNPKIPKSVPRVISHQNVMELAETVANLEDQDWLKLRNKLIILLIYSSGVRISEALSICRNDIRNGFIMILGKGSKMREVPIMPEISDLIGGYIGLCPYTIKDDRPMFLTVRGCILSRTYFANIIRRARNAILLPKHTCAHSLRGSCATELLRAGANLRSIQKLLGHESLSTTQKYTKLDLGKINNVYKKAHPS